ncbi:DUF2778 domain-containing protein [Rhizobium sp. SSA_523]|uniref:DUF2778 domain-containing protein n=1 Tax=Rhizobium sp. SSA_523 TaxID=2952477 RepID=UPI0020906D32|nr:DUF2778 domain-containing protein [Rhizobium sp. SSA_523]MCO5730272.1 DUF2778 domain-containing protein [Rhizobium sp. SSA_523]WKC25327.1 DUF2778 domain-containing protein [Rhizobium sp. SSA_523]
MALAFAAARSASVSSRTSRLDAKPVFSSRLMKATVALGMTLAVGGWMVGALATVQSVASVKPHGYSYDLRASLDLKPLLAPVSDEQRALKIAKFARLSAGATPKMARLDGAHMAHLAALKPDQAEVKDSLALAFARAEADKQFASLALSRPDPSRVKDALASAMQDTVLVAPPSNVAWDANPPGNAADGEIEIADLQSPAELAVAEATGPSEDNSLPMAGPLPIVRPPANALAMAIAPSAVKPSTRAKPAIVEEDEDEDATTALAFAKPENPMKRTAPSVPWPDRGTKIAVYDITAGKVFMPNGSVLEAHSGIGSMRDNPKFTHVKMRGPTPPGTYRLSMREKLFHGVAAIRLTPTDGIAPQGRTGLLAHTYLLRSRPGDSHGCVAFANYDKFLKAFQRGEVTHMIIVPRHDGSIPMAALRKINPRGGSGSNVAATPVSADGSKSRTLMDYLKNDG